MTVTDWPLGIGAMFPIAPGFERKYSARPRLVVPACQVTASEDLPVGALSEPFPLNDYQQHEILGSGSVSLTSEGVLKWCSSSVTSDSSAKWPIAIRLSSDCHSANVLHETAGSGRLRLRIVRAISEGQELLAWFSHGMLPLVGIPFLTPFNIQGEKNYICHMCGRAFEQPNPLKLHLSLDCDREQISTLWLRLGQHLQNEKPPIRFTFELTPTPKRPTILPTEIQSSTSAFKPYWRINDSSSGSISADNENTPQQLQHSYGQREAQMEALASNLGKSKHGHVCIYCGKIYSRKYGLKIHIRTHTGYKPLQCKFCMRPFGDPSNLNKHVRLHAEGDTPYKCELCGKILVRRRDLERHIKSRHSPEDTTD